MKGTSRNLALSRFGRAVLLGLVVLCPLVHSAVDGGERSTDSEQVEQLGRKRLLEELLEIEPPMEGPHRREDMREPSEFMLQVYKEIADVTTGQLRRTDDKDPLSAGPELREAIYSFSSTEVVKHTEVIRRERRNETLSGWRLSFDMHQLRTKKPRRKVKYAELAIYGKHCQADAEKRNKIAARRTSVLTFTQLRLPGSGGEGGSGGGGGDDATSPLAWVPVVSPQHIRLRDCWQRFNVTLAVREWQKRSSNHSRQQQQHGKLLLVTEQRPDRRQQVDGVGLDDVLELHDQTGGNHAVLVAYYGKPVAKQQQQQQQQQTEGETSRRGRRSVGLLPSKKKKKSMPVRDRSYPLCARRLLRVQSQHIGLDIVMPKKGINIFRCAGSCNPPIHYVQRTNHAMMENFYNRRNPIQDPRLPPRGPCCVPTQLQGFSVLVWAGNNNLVLKTYKKLAAVRCGCR